jgi:hypothetical protein
MRCTSAAPNASQADGRDASAARPTGIHAAHQARAPTTDRPCARDEQRFAEVAT